MRDCDPDRARPNGRVVHHKSRHEVLVFAGRNPVLQEHADHLVAGALRAVPRAVLGRKRIAAVFRGELVIVVEHHSHGRRMGLDQHVGYGDLVLEVGPFAAMARIFVGPQIVPRPAVERTKTSTAARSVSGPQALPSPCAASQRAIAAASRLPMPSPSFDADPTETNILRPSCEKTMSRVLWPRCTERPATPARSRTITSGFPRGLRSPLR